MNAANILHKETINLKICKRNFKDLSFLLIVHQLYYVDINRIISKRTFEGIFTFHYYLFVPLAQTTKLKKFTGLFL